MTKKDVQIGPCRMIQGDAVAILPTLPDASVQLLLVDPPYYRVKAEAWDRQWRTRDAYVTWLRAIALEWRRILTPNGSLYCFASPQMAAWVEVMLSEIFHVLNHIVWIKHDGSGAGTGGHSKVCKDDLRSYFPQTERILFCEQYGSDSMALGDSGYAAQCDTLHRGIFEPLRAYLDSERRRAGMSKAEVNAACGFAPISGAMASRHYFSTSQWQLPTREHYQAMQQLFNKNGHTDYLRREYEDLRRPFALSADVPYTDVWTFATVQASPGKHPCEKPLGLLRHIITASSRPGDTVLDCFAGSGSTLDAARQCGRQAIGIEQDARWWRRACQRLNQMDCFEHTVLHDNTTRRPEQPSLFRPGGSPA
jgi:site-specific DNA-methyltransferase (adenine-specific)